MLFYPANITRSLTATLFSASVAFGLSATVYAETPTLPDTMTWSSYDVGSAGYAEASAIADAFGKKYGTRIRIKPSGSAIGRLQPLLSGDATVGFLAFAGSIWTPTIKAIAEGKGKSDEEFAEIWEKHRQKALGAL